MTYKLQDLIDLEQFQILQDRLNEIYCFPSAIIDLEGHILTATAWQDICTQFHRKNPECERECRKSDQYILSHLQEANPAVSYRCPHGLVDNAAPIIINGVHYGNFFTGQFFLEAPDREFFRAQAKKYGFDEDAYLKAVDQVPIWTKEQLNSYLFFIKGLIVILSETGVKRLKEMETRKHAQEIEHRYHSLLQTAMDGFWMVDVEGRLLEVNEAYCRMSGYSKPELMAMRIYDLEALETPADTAAHIRKISLAGEDRFESWHRRKDGSRFAVEISVQCKPDAGGCHFAFLRDITERKRAEGALTAERNLLRTLLNNLPDLVFTKDAGARVIQCNTAAAQFLGLSEAEMTGKSVFDVNPPDLARGYDADDLRVLRAGEIVDNREEQVRDHNGLLHWFLTTKAPVRDPGGRVVGLVAICRNIDERKRAEEVLRESETRYHNLADSGQGLIWTSGLDKQCDYFNQPWLAFTGRTLAQELGDGWIEGVHPDDLQRCVEIYGGAFDRRESFSMDYRLRHHDGEFRWIQDNGTPRYDGQGNFLGYIGHCLDITERKRAEEKMRAISSRLHLATTSVKAGVWDWNLQTNQMIWDDRMLELYGLTREDFPGGIEAWEQGLHPKDAARAKEECQAALRGERDFDTEFRVVHPDGKVLHIKANGLVLRDEQGKLLHMIGLNSDITERKALEEQLRQAQKLESIGQLAGGVAHDFNNILASVMMHLSSLQENPRHDSETQESLAEVMLQVDRAANLTRQLLMFSRQSVMEVKVLDLSELVANLLKMLGRLIGEHILVQFNRREGWTSVEADAGMIEQVLMNLAVNARDAMPKGGTLTIGLEPIQVAVEHVKGNPEARFGTFVCLSVADTGCGMDDATVKRIFEPFFTTKEPGKGTGLGLATVNGIVAQHKGWVEVKSEPGKGTTFKIYLPAAAKKAAEANRPAKIPLRRGHETILLVEDEASVRRPVVRNLQQLGYRVLEASNGQVALEVWQAHAGQIDLLFSDMVMPEGLTGLDLAEKLRAEKPSLKVILSSGYNQEMAGHAIPAGGGFVFLQKPYQLLELSKTIRACLDRDEGECPGKLAQPGRRSP